MKKLYLILFLLFSIAFIGYQNKHYDFQQLEIQKIDAGKLNDYYVLQFNKKGAYLLSVGNEQAIVFCDVENSISNIDIKNDNGELVVYYQSDSKDDDELTIYKDVYLFQNNMNFDSIDVYLNGEQTGFVRVFVSDESIFK